MVTGATGFVGANLARALLVGGDECHLLARENSNRWRLRGVEKELHWHPGDVCDAESVRAAFQAARPDRAFHLAVYGAYSWERGLRRMLDVNVVGTDHVLTAAAAVDCGVVVVAGSSSEYGDCDHAPDEAEATAPNSDYAVSKAAASGLARHRAGLLGLRVPILRLYSVYGPYEDPKRLIPTLLRACLGGRLPPLAGPDTVRDFVFVDDVVSAHVLASAPGKVERGRIFNIGSGRETRLDELVGLARELFGVADEPEFGAYPRRRWDIPVWISNPARARKELGWIASTSLREGLLATAEWLRSTASVPRGG